MPHRLFHTTRSAEAILRDGFRDGRDAYGFSQPQTGVFLANRPANLMDGAVGDQVLEVALPDYVNMDDYAITEEGLETWEWLCPADLLNAKAAARLLTEEEIHEATPTPHLPM